MKDIRTKKDFDAELAAGGERLMLFYSGWCHFCGEIMPALEKRARHSPAVFIKLCVDDLPALEEHFAVEVVPTVLFFKDGRLANRLDGVLGRGLTEEKLDTFAAVCGIKPA